MEIRKSAGSVGMLLKAAIKFLFSPQMRRSSIGFLLAFVLAFLGMGITGIGLFFLVTPALNLLLGLNLPMDATGIDQLKGVSIGPDAMWPTLILVSMLWSFGFLIAGFVTKEAEAFKLPSILKNCIYALILWSWALCLWVFAIKIGFVA
jgi:hypothetical protein